MSLFPIFLGRISLFQSFLAPFVSKVLETVFFLWGWLENAVARQCLASGRARSLRSLASIPSAVPSRSGRCVGCGSNTKGKRAKCGSKSITCKGHEDYLEVSEPGRSKFLILVDFGQADRPTDRRTRPSKTPGGGSSPRKRRKPRGLASGTSVGAAFQGQGRLWGSEMPGAVGDAAFRGRFWRERREREARRGSSARRRRAPRPRPGGSSRILSPPAGPGAGIGAESQKGRRRAGEGRKAGRVRPVTPSPRPGRGRSRPAPKSAKSPAGVSGPRFARRSRGDRAGPPSW